MVRNEATNCECCCSCPDRVLHNDRGLMRLLASGLIHVDDYHLYHNMISFVWKGYKLEYKLGSMRFLFSICYLLVLCHTLVVLNNSKFMYVSCYLPSLAFPTDFALQGPLHQCSVGFSGVLFALKVSNKFDFLDMQLVLLNHNSPAWSSVYGFEVPTKYAAWLELVVIHFLVPDSSFMGHMCGILAGYICVYSPSMQSIMIFASRAISRQVQVLIRRITNRCSQTTSHHDRRTSTRSTTPSFKTDEELAWRLQEEEYRSQPLPEDLEPTGISPNELRRRRLARFGNGQR
ncbi:hypothetical protein PsorP6_008267 [Peronosclerospora sorghi]|uniref:Uncharacterized protein n=1 Tax=Peronosclerospora sorghi TaxID=230839 RepID=A0ACC0WBY2_9STRA|nr:hypothetical protein PsorP6_008267 [Peronosclerospora sorghi]